MLTITMMIVTMQTKLHDPFSKPGFLIRRLQQLSVRIFLEETSAFDITPVQYGALEVISERPGIDQITLSQATDVDRTTIVRILDRLQAMGLMRKEPSQTDRRANLLFITPKGEELLDAAYAATEASQARLMSPLSQKEQAQFLALAAKLVLVHTAPDGDAKAAAEGSSR